MDELKQRAHSPQQVAGNFNLGKSLYSCHIIPLSLGVYNIDCSKAMYEDDLGHEDKCVNYARTHGLTSDSTAPVKSYSSNAWALYDMRGNVWEWCQDWYGGRPSGHLTDPSGPRHRVQPVLFVAVPGTTTLGACGLRVATGAILATGATTAVSALPGTIKLHLTPLPLYPLKRSACRPLGIA